jgi:hypothetical protein
MLFGKVLSAPKYSDEVIWLDGRKQIWRYTGETWKQLEETTFKQPNNSSSRPVQDMLFGKVSSASRYSDEVIWLDGRKQIWRHTGETWHQLEEPSFKQPDDSTSRIVQDSTADESSISLCNFLNECCIKHEFDNSPCLNERGCECSAFQCSRKDYVQVFTPPIMPNTRRDEIKEPKSFVKNPSLGRQRYKRTEIMMLPDHTIPTTKRLNIRLRCLFQTSLKGVGYY